MTTEPRRRSFWQRIFGISSTRPPVDSGSWTFANGKLVLDLARIPELSEAGSGVRLEGQELPKRILVVHGDDGSFHAFHNKCKHFGRRMDPLAGTGTVECSSVNKATYRYSGEVISGPAKGPLETFPVEEADGKLTVTVE